MGRVLIVAAAAAALCGCASRTAVTHVAPAVVHSTPRPSWQDVVSKADLDRLARLPDTWHAALQSVSGASRKLLAREGDLLAPNAARELPATPPGSYRCRLVKIGVPAGREPSVRSFPDFFCYVRAESGDRLSFTKQTGTELPGGWLHRDGNRRMVLTGASQRVAGDNSLAYGSEPDRDLIGVVERIGPFRWRLVLPWRGTRPGLDVYELTPVPTDKQAVEPRLADRSAAN